ncbi:MAG TPA: signal peptidase II [Caulobacteraceae bacterium]|nr:signal peptidase II [Caulobacteraceae bacterium]
MADEARAPLVNGNGKLAFALAAVVVVLDQAIKAFLLGPFDLLDKGLVKVIPLFALDSVWNPGVAFGMLRAESPTGRWLLVGFAACVVVALGLWARRMDRWLGAVGVGLIMGGAIGNNVIDRVRWGEVFDYLHWTGPFFPWVINLADASISVGVGVLVLDSLIDARHAKR